jgi:hypothetical protein
MYVQRLLCGAGLALGLAATAHAAVVDLRFEDKPGAVRGFQILGPNYYLGSQLAFQDAADDADFDFHFTYDTDSLAPNHDLTLVSGRVGSITDFSGFTPYLIFGASSQLTIGLVESDSGYVTGVYFVMVDNDGDIPATLPTTLDLGALDQANVSFETRLPGAVGPGYFNVYYAAFQGVVSVPSGTGGSDPGAGGTVSGAPEPAAWALMILGFGAVGGIVRRRRYAASNWSAARRA